MHMIQIKNENFTDYVNRDPDFYKSNILKFNSLDISILEFFLDVPSFVAFEDIHLLANVDTIALFTIKKEARDKLINALSKLKIIDNPSNCIGTYKEKCLIIMHSESEEFIALVKRYCVDVAIAYKDNVVPLVSLIQTNIKPSLVRIRLLKTMKNIPSSCETITCEFPMLKYINPFVNMSPKTYLICSHYCSLIFQKT